VPRKRQVWKYEEVTADSPDLAELREVNEQLLISGLREQELAAAILADIGDAVLVVDRAGRTVLANAVYATMGGDTPLPLVPRDAQGAPMPPEQTPQARAARGETFSLEFTLTASDGQRRWFEAKGQPLHSGVAGHAVVVIRDITLSTQNRRLQDEFLSLASHELRTPLTSAQGYLELVLRGAQRTGMDDRLVHFTTSALEAVHRLAALIQDLTDVGRLQSGKLTLTLAPLDLVPLVKRVVEVAQDLPPGRAIHVEAPAAPLGVHGDAGRLEQVLFNLLTNAVIHASSEAPIDVRLRRQQGQIVLAVQDYGRGIAAAELPKLFDRFYQVFSHDRPSTGGMGLGLFICHEVVTAHGGRITVASIEGEGTTFTVWLPSLTTDVSDGPIDASHG
jgi:two-component system CheB/CheR fusion protein